ncbi:PIF1-like helicase-domain-containing protein, partial [Daedaleopsis nitida]
MPLPLHDWEADVENPLIAEQLNYDIDEERRLSAVYVPQLNDDQRHAFDRIVDSAVNNKGETYLLHGAGGTGKTFVYKAICHKLRSEGHIVLCASSSGISSLLLIGGRTAHSMFKIPVEDLGPESTCKFTKESLRAALFRRARLAVWDEVSNQHCHAIEATDRSLRDVRGVDRPFGGLTMV